MKVILRNSNLKFETKKTLVEQSTLNNASMNDFSHPGEVMGDVTSYRLFIYKNVSGTNLKFNLTGKGNTWTNTGYIYGIFDEEPVVGSIAINYYSLPSVGQNFNLDVIVPNGKYIGISEFCYAPASGGSCVVTYEEV